MRYVVRRSLLPRVDDMLEPPSPASDDHPIELGAQPPDSSSEVKPDPPGPPVNPSVKTPDPKPNPDNTEPSEGSQRRTIRGWFKTMTKRNRNWTSHQMPSEDRTTPPTKTPPSNKKSSTVSYGQRIRVSVPCLRVGEAQILTGCLSGL